MIIYTPASSRVILLDMGFTEDSTDNRRSDLLCVITHTKRFFKSAFSDYVEATEFAIGSQFMTTSEIETFLKLSSV